MKKKLLAILLALTTVGMLMGCGAKTLEEPPITDGIEQDSQAGNLNDDMGNIEDDNAGEQGDVVDADSAVGAFTAVWNNVEQFAAVGGSLSSSVDGAPGAVALDDTDFMTNTLLIPADAQSNATEIASLMHMMNSNTFTGIAVKAEGVTDADIASAWVEGFKNNQFMCGAPEKIVIVNYNDVILCFFGETSIVDDFAKAATELGATELASDVY